MELSKKETQENLRIQNNTWHTVTFQEHLQSNGKTHDLARSQVVVIIKSSAGDLNAQLGWRTSAVELAQWWFH